MNADDRLIKASVTVLPSLPAANVTPTPAGKDYEKYGKCHRVHYFVFKHFTIDFLRYSRRPLLVLMS